MGSSNVARAAFAQTGTIPVSPHETVMPLPACRSVGGSETGICKCLPGGHGADNDWPSLTASWHGVSVAASGVATVAAAAVLGYDDIKTVRFFGVELEEVREHSQL